jgi:hypothetical protein
MVSIRRRHGGDGPRGDQIGGSGRSREGDRSGISSEKGKEALSAVAAPGGVLSMVGVSSSGSDPAPRGAGFDLVLVVLILKPAFCEGCSSKASPRLNFALL